MQSLKKLLRTIRESIAAIDKELDSNKLDEPERSNLANLRDGLSSALNAWEKSKPEKSKPEK